MSEQNKVHAKIVRKHPQTGELCFVSPHSLVPDPEVAGMVEEIEKIGFAWFEISAKAMLIMVNAIDMCVAATECAKALEKGIPESDEYFMFMEGKHQTAFVNLNKVVHSCPKEFGFMLGRLSQLTTYHIMDDNSQYPHPDSEESRQQ